MTTASQQGIHSSSTFFPEYNYCPSKVLTKYNLIVQEANIIRNSEKELIKIEL